MLLLHDPDRTMETERFDEDMAFHYIHDARLSTTACATVGANETSLLIDKRFLSTHRTHLSAGLCAIADVLFEGALHTYLPRVNALILKL